ncbi:MAG: HAD family hydrolase [Eubacterium sp.]
MYKACIFDLDGTLLDTLESIATSANKAIGCFGYEPHPLEKFKKFAGDGQIELLRRCLIESGDVNASHLQEALEKYRQIFASGCGFHVKPYEGIIEMLTKLKNKNIKIAVFSNKNHENVVTALDGAFGRGYFDYVYGKQEGIPLKPSPEGGFKIMEALNVTPAECIYVGDTDTDMKTGKNLGAFTVGVTWGFRDEDELRSEGADAIISYPLELIELL